MTRTRVKSALARTGSQAPAEGATLLIYHRVGGGSPDERDLPVSAFAAQLDELAGHDVVALDVALDRLAVGRSDPSVVLTFDDGFADVYENAWPLLRARSVPFTVYLCTAYVGGTMHWDGSTARSAGPGLTWAQLAEMTESGLCTVGNHTHSHARPARLGPEELDVCTDLVESRLGHAPQHFAFTWGVPVPAMLPALRQRFRSACTGELGRNRPGVDPMLLRRVPVRASDPLPFFRRKLTGRLGPERAYGQLVRLAKVAGARA